MSLFESTGNRFDGKPPDRMDLATQGLWPTVPDLEHQARKKIELALKPRIVRVNGIWRVKPCHVPIDSWPFVEAKWAAARQFCRRQNDIRMTNILWGLFQ